MDTYTVPADMVDDNRMPAAYARADQIIARLNDYSDQRVTRAQRDHIAVSQFYEPRHGHHEISPETGHVLIRDIYCGRQGNVEINRAGNVVSEW
jgi:hypothetical protein